MEHTIDTQTMQSVKALADTNIKISEARSVLFKLQETETEYLVEREKKILSRIQDNLEQSRSLIDETSKNHQGIKDLYSQCTSFVEFLDEVYDSFQEIVKNFDERSDMWEAKIGIQQDEILEQRKEIKIEQVRIKNDQKSLKDKEKLLQNMKSHIESRQAALESSYKIEKEIWNKIQNKN